MSIPYKYNNIRVDCNMFVGTVSERSDVMN